MGVIVVHYVFNARYPLQDCMHFVQSIRKFTSQHIGGLVTKFTAIAADLNIMPMLGFLNQNKGEKESQKKSQIQKNYQMKAQCVQNESTHNGE